MSLQVQDYGQKTAKTSRVQDKAMRSESRYQILAIEISPWRTGMNVLATLRTFVTLQWTDRTIETMPDGPIPFATI